MCADPLTLASIGATVAGTAINARNNQAYRDAVNDENNKAAKLANEARRAEMSRQDDLSDERTATFMDIAEAANPEAARVEIDQTADDALDQVLEGRRFKGSVPTWMSGASRTPEALSEVANRVVGSKRGALAAAARLRAGQGQDSDTAMALRRGFSTQDFLGDRMRGSLGVSEQERSISPGFVSKPTGMMGDLLIAGGQYGANRGGYRAGHAQTSGG